MRHSCAHVMAQAVMRLFDGVQLAFGPTTDNGFYYDFQLPQLALRGGLSADRSRDAQDRQGRRAVRAARRAAREGARALPRAGAGVQGRAHQDGLADEATLSFYRQGEFIDLCRGRHIPSTGPIGAFKLLSVAGAYWKGDANRASSCSGSTPPPSSTRKNSTPISSRSKRPSAAIIACSASSSSCSPSARWSARA